MKVPPPSPPELRYDKFSGSWIVVASERARKPDQHAEIPESGARGCPFCPGHELETPGDVYMIPDKEQPSHASWRVRAFDNLYPAVHAPDRAVLTAQGDASVRPALGVHEVIIECPEHRVSIAGCSPGQMGLVFEAYRDRIAAARRRLGRGYALLFKNSGRYAGASQEHAHSQLIATELIPPWIARELEHSAAHRASTGRCVHCEIIESEVRIGERVVCEDADFVVRAPFAPRFPYELWIVPKNHASRFEESDEEPLRRLGSLMLDLIQRLEALHRRAAFNYYIHTAPLDDADYSHFHWHVELVPRLVGLAGFELGAGMHINPIPPEWAARAYRSAASSRAKST